MKFDMQIVNRPQRIYRWTLIFWFIAVLFDCAWYLHGVFNQQPSPDEYANTFAFQVIAYALTRFLYWLLAIFMVIMIEVIVFGRLHKTKSDNLKDVSL